MRVIPVASDLQPVLREGLKRCRPEDFVFPGSLEGAHLSGRTVQRIVREAAKRAGVDKPVSAMTLRHAYAVHLLDRGLSVPELMQRLGHKRVETTLIYESCRLPKGAVSPLDLPEKPAAEPLYEEPLDIAPLTIPFPADPAGTFLDRAGEFCQVLKARLVGRFLALRSYRRRPAPAGSSG